MKKHLLVFLNVLLISFCFAQRNQNVYFLKNNGKEVSKDSSDFIRIIQEPDSGSVHFNLMEYYPNQSKKRIGHVSRFEPSLVLEGPVTTYYKNGSKQEFSTYEKGKVIGERSFYYSNNQLKKKIVHDDPTDQPDISGSKSRLISFYDFTGTELIKDGTGYYKAYDQGTDLQEEGAYLNGVKDGLWKGQYVKKLNAFEESYNKGKFISGTVRMWDGTVKQYDKEESLPDYKGGIGEFLSFVGRHYKYSRDAQRYGVSGRVLIGFVVERDGSLTDIKVLRDLGYGTGEEAIRVIKASQKWIPGEQHGIPVRVSYTLPLKLQLTRN